MNDNFRVFTDEEQKIYDNLKVPNLDLGQREQYMFNRRRMEEQQEKETMSIADGFFPPPWNIYDHPEKTEGWIEFQKAMRENPDYYLS